MELRFIETLEAQHRETESVFVQLKQTIAEMTEAPAIADVLVAAYRKLVARMASMYRLHIQSEDDILVRIARRALDGDQINAISREMRNRRNNR